MTTTEAAPAAHDQPIEATATEVVRPAEPAAPETLPAVTDAPVRFAEAQQRVSLLRTFVDLAARVAGTEFVPKGLRGKPAAVLACILTGQEMGIGPMQSLQHIHVVDGKPTQSAELMRAQIMRGGHRFSIREKSNERVVVYGCRADTGEELTITWTMADAQRAKLVKGGGAWETYPRAMLMARATAELARDLFADVLGGVSYTPEELGAEVMVTEGGYIDVDATDTIGPSPQAEGGLDPTAAWDRVGEMKPREVMEALRARGLPATGKVEELRATLADALTSTAPELAAAQDRAAEAPGSSGEQPSAAEGTETPDAAPGAQEGAQDAPDEAFTIAEMVAAMPIRQVLEELDDRKDRLPAALPGSPKAQRALLQVVLEAEAAREAPIGQATEG